MNRALKHNAFDVKINISKVNTDDLTRQQSREYKLYENRLKEVTKILVINTGTKIDQLNKLVIQKNAYKQLHIVFKNIHQNIFKLFLQVAEYSELAALFLYIVYNVSSYFYACYNCI